MKSFGSKCRVLKLCIVVYCGEVLYCIVLWYIVVKY